MLKQRGSAVVTLRVAPDLDRRMVLREALESAFGGEAPLADPAQEARRQSSIVSGRESERKALGFIESAADGKGWR